MIKVCAEAAAVSAELCNKVQLKEFNVYTHGAKCYFLEIRRSAHDNKESNISAPNRCRLAFRKESDLGCTLCTTQVTLL